MPEVRGNIKFDEYNEEVECFEEPRSIEEIVEATEEFFDKIWFDRHLLTKISN